MAFTRVSVKVVSVMMLLQGLVIIGGAAYVASVSMSNFVYVLGGVGLYVLLVGLMGVRLVSGNRSYDQSSSLSGGGCCYTLFATMLFVLIVFHAVLVIGFLKYEDRTIEILQDLNSHGDNSSIRSYLDDHRTELKWSALSVLAVEFIAFSMVVCCGASVRNDHRSHGGDDVHEEYRSLDVGMDDRGLITAPSLYDTPSPSATPQTDARRAALSEKYGGAFDKKSTNNRSTSFNTYAAARV